MIANQSQVVLGTTSLEITREPVGSNTPELFPKTQIVGVFPMKINTKPSAPDDQNWKYRFDQTVMVDIHMSDGNHVSFDLQEVTNQVTWTANLAGLQQCVADLNAWL